jgi:hypothetical protein
MWDPARASRGAARSIRNWLRVSHIGLCYGRVWRNLLQEVASTRGTRGQDTMSTRAQHAATTPIPVQLSAPEFHALIWPHLSRPKRGPTCQLGDHRVFNLYGGVSLPLATAHGGCPLTRQTRAVCPFPLCPYRGGVPCSSQPCPGGCPELSQSRWFPFSVRAEPTHGVVSSPLASGRFSAPHRAESCLGGLLLLHITTLAVFPVHTSHGGFP